MRFRPRSIRCLWFILLASVFAQAQQAAPAATKRALFWKATSPSTTVYLLGSVHLADKEMYPLAEPVESAFQSSKVLLVEVNIKKYDKAEMAAMVQKRALYTDGTTLSQHIHPATSHAVDAFCQANDLPRAAVEPMKPWMVSTLVSLLPLEKAGINGEQGLDVHFMNSVTPQQRIEELESAEAQFDLLAAGSEAEQEQALAEAVKQSPKALGYMRRIQDAFLRADPEAVRKLMDETNTGPQSLRKRLLEDRNGPMADRIEQYLKGKEQVFVVVGAAHMIGEQGIVRLLRDRNYKVEPVFPAE